MSCGGNEEPDPPALLDVTIVDSGDRFQTAYRLADGRLTRMSGGFARRTVFSRAGSEPDRQSIVWEEIYVREPDGSERRLTNDQRADLAPQLLRDGRVSFVSCTFHDDDVPPQCTLDAIDPGTGDRETLLNELGIVFGGELSPDESTFLYTRLGASGVPLGLFVRELDGGDERRLPVMGVGGTWSPDGRRIAFVSDRDRNGRCLFHDCIGFADEIYVADADGSDEQRLTEDSADESVPEWSGDGEWLVFGRIPDEDADWDLYAVRADGECEIQLTDTPRWERSATWHGAGHGGLSC
jgi:Tol biopolymer transport system component